VQLNRSKQLTLKASLALVALCCIAGTACAAEDDLGMWNLVFVNHAINETWAASLQLEGRMQDDISAFDEFIVKPGGYYRFNEWAQLGVGYKNITKYEESNEQDIWQELYLSQKWGHLGVTHQFRLEERFIHHINGILPRVRYLIDIKKPLNSSFYLAFSEAARFNLDNKGEGPVSGFEQNRLYGGIGYNASNTSRIEFGYLWRYERERSDADKSDHVIRLQFKFTTKVPHPEHGGS